MDLSDRSPGAGVTIVITGKVLVWATEKVMSNTVTFTTDEGWNGGASVDVELDLPVGGLVYPANRSVSPCAWLLGCLASLRCSLGRCIWYWREGGGSSPGGSERRTWPRIGIEESRLHCMPVQRSRFRVRHASVHGPLGPVGRWPAATRARFRVYLDDKPA